ncbi:MAG TPA: hypothetical protein VK540_17825 [Polyangiaceae bacterium]|nr:hypothetical protein [Polyangiaceae bacterium]
MMALLKEPVAVDAITSREDRFRCEPYRITVTADTCCRRRALVRAGIHKFEFLHCGEECPIGKVVEQNSGGPMQVSRSLIEAASARGGSYKVRRAEAFGVSFEGEKSRARSEAADEKRRRYQRERYRAAHPKAENPLTAIAGGRVDPDEPTIPTLGDSMPIARRLPKAPPGRVATVLPAADVNPQVRAGGVGGARIRSVNGGLMVDRPGLPVVGPFPDLETAARVAGSIDAPAETSPPALPPATVKEEMAMGGKWTPEQKAKFQATMAARKEARGKGGAKRKKTGPKPKPARRVAPHMNGVATAGNVRGHIEQALEDHELVEKVGRELVLALARRIDEART